MDRAKLEKCKTFEELAKEIWLQNYEISKVEHGQELGMYINGSTTMLYGLYLKFVRTITNSPFDVFFNIMATTYGKVLNSYDEDTLDNASIQAYEVLLLYFQGKFKFKFIPNTPHDFVEFLFDKQREGLCEELIYYLQGIQKRYVKNKLYCRKEGSDTCSISDIKYQWHINKRNEKGKVVSQKIYVDITKVELDKPANESSDNRETQHWILDDFLSQQGIVNDVEGQVFEFGDEQESLYMYLYNILNEKHKSFIDELKKNVGHYVKKGFYKECEKHDTLNVLEDGSIKFFYNSSFLNFGLKFMNADRISKFYMVKEILNKNRGSANKILINIIYCELDVKTYRKLTEMLKCENRYQIIKYCNKEFLIVVNGILQRYFEEQNKVKQITLFNEKERLKKIAMCEEYIRSKEKNKMLMTKDINQIFIYVDKVFDLRTSKKYMKSKVDMKLKLSIMKSLGFIFVKINNSYKLERLNV